MTLTEFLLARIAEDEDQARLRMHYAQQNYLMLQEPKLLGQFIPGWGEWPDIESFAARVLAECEAKRAIVEVRGLVDSIARTAPEDEASQARDTRTGIDVALSALALPYADHPDYLDEWRP